MFDGGKREKRGQKIKITCIYRVPIYFECTDLKLTYACLDNGCVIVQFTQEGVVQKGQI